MEPPLLPAAAEGPRLQRATDARSEQRFAEVLGPRVALLGDELGRFEAWIWPLKVLRRLEPSFSVAGATWTAAQASRSIEVLPHETVLRYAGPDWSAALTYFASPIERAVVGLIEVDATGEVLVELEIEPELRPMWPAGLTGQVAGRDDETGALWIGEELGRFAALCGSQEADPARAVGDPALTREPVRIALHVPPARARRGPVPFFLVGAEVQSPGVTDATHSGAISESRSERALQEARALFWRATKDWQRWRVEARERWPVFLDRTARLECPDARASAAFLWSKLAVERCWAEVDSVGRGLVAGLAPSRGGERPGRGWFCDGDALAAAQALGAYGDFGGARDVLRFSASHQRKDGRLMNELVLSAGLCRWTEDYPFAYAKLPDTPAFLVALAQYVAASGDLELARELWPNALLAFEHCWRALGEDGLVRVHEFGAAAVESEPVAGALRAEAHAQAIWISAARAVRDLAGLLGEPELQQRARREFERAETAFESFWSEERGRYGFALRADGSLCDDLASHLALPLARGLGQPERALATSVALHLPHQATDWGPRLFAADASLSQSEGEDCSRVFPHLALHAILAQYRLGSSAAGWQMLAEQIGAWGCSGLGLVPEHLDGDGCSAPPRAVSHQIAASAAIPQAAIYGLFGISGHAVEGALLVRPALPPQWDHMVLRHFRLGECLLDLEVARRRSVGSSTLALRATLHAGPPLKLFFRPWFPALTRSVDQRLGAGGRPHPVALEACGASLSPQGAGVELARGSEQILYGCELGPELELGSTDELSEGVRSSRVRLCGARALGEHLVWTLYGPQGTQVQLPLHTDRVVRVSGATLEGGALTVAFPAAVQEFSSTEVRLEAEP